jgi:small-conductance mechanosensitive channel
MNYLLTTLDKLYLNNSLNQWLWAIATAAGIWVVTLFVRRFFRRHYARMAATERVELMEVPLQIVSKTNTLFLIVLGLFFGALTLTLPATVHSIAEKVLLIGVCWQVGIWATTGALAWIDLKRRNSMVEDRAAAGTLGIIAVIVRTLIWSVVLLLTLDNLGINVTTLVAGLGIGGIAVALAVQNVLGDLLASLSITLDKPFVLGDFLILGDFMGSVEYIGIKSTRLRSLGGEQIIMSNSDLLNSRTRNYGRMQERRVVFAVGVTYETPRVKLEKISGMIRGIIESMDKVRMDRSHMARFGAFSIDYEIVYYVLSPDYGVYMDIQQQINLRICEAFENNQIEFAYPTQKLWLANAVEGTAPQVQPT